jgi:hypothetical protein
MNAMRGIEIARMFCGVDFMPPLQGERCLLDVFLGLHPRLSHDGLSALQG